MVDGFAPPGRAFQDPAQGAAYGLIQAHPAAAARAIGAPHP